MRVIGGEAKGRRLKVPKGQALRPTAARVKEALFNILPHDLSGFKVLDLFAGTGNLALEALSRGAKDALLVDVSRAAGKTIQENLRAVGFSDRARVWIAPVQRSLQRLSRNGEKFDLILVDPPYQKDLLGGVLRAIAHGGLLRETGLLIAEHGVKEGVEKAYGPLTLQDQRRYGGTLLSFFAIEHALTQREKEDGTNEHSGLSRLL